MGDDHGNTAPSKLGGKLCGAITPSLRVADVEHEIFACTSVVPSQRRPRVVPSRRRASALRHGAWSQAAVLPGEDLRQFDRLCCELADEWHPSGPAEEDAIFTLAKCMWRKRRLRTLCALDSLSERGWAPGELEIEERLDQLIDRALRRLGQMKAMKAVFAAQWNAPKALPYTGAEAEIDAPSGAAE
jgi:hypothetical protein